ncbi:nucleotidyltransferase [Acidianus sulfidivorans JP7]|uniref:Nucleotidyltransferase n=1 Tax=Acidianus sulfidivorans JP7 TaxID=619593 RepID=A0A2U9IMW8_9CREN|nr:nucleotidyltransferase [Acidianus sulfidivorans]AWR97356.1 nucleotidyltransferase [Acidianus sulfidivorans JP7]
MISFNSIGDVLEKLQGIIDFVIIGDTIVELTLNRKGTDSDVDLFPTNSSVFSEEEKIRQFCAENGWDYGSTPLDTPRLIVPVSEGQLQIDIYDNIQDFYVPQEIISNAKTMKVGKKAFKVIRLEDYILLKANAYREEDEKELKDLLKIIGEKNIKIDKVYLESHIDLFEENSNSIKQRLKDIGFTLS